MQRGMTAVCLCGWTHTCLSSVSYDTRQKCVVCVCGVVCSRQQPYIAARHSLYELPRYLLDSTTRLPDPTLSQLRDRSRMATCKLQAQLGTRDTH